MPPILSFKFLGNLLGKSSESGNKVNASEEEQGPTSQESRSSKSGVSKEKSIREGEKPAASKETSSRQRTKRVTSKDDGAATSIDGSSKSLEISEEESSGRRKKSADSKQTGSSQGTKTKEISSESRSTKSKESSAQAKKPALAKESSPHQKTRTTASRGTGAQKTMPLNKGTSSSESRKNVKVVQTVRPGEIFKNHESIPTMAAAYKQFVKIYREYLDTITVDRIRAEEYLHLEESGHICLDYSGYGLFSESQQRLDKASSSFGLSYISGNLPTHALYGGADEGTAEFDVKRRVCDFLNIEEDEYTMVFTASRGSAFKLLAESYPFHLRKRLLTVYDFVSDAVNWMEDAAKKKGASVVNASFRWPSQRLWATDLKKKILEKKKKKEPGKGLLVFPVQSRATGAKYSYQWMSQAQENDWDVLLDASALGPKVMGTLGLSVFRPEFIVSSFYKVYGSDPTGFGCLLIKRSAIQILHSSSAARGVGMVKLVPSAAAAAAPVMPDRFSNAEDESYKQEGEIEEEEEEGESDSLSRALPGQVTDRQVIPVASFSGPIIRSNKALSNRFRKDPAASKPERAAEFETTINPAAFHGAHSEVQATEAPRPFNHELYAESQECPTSEEPHHVTNTDMSSPFGFLDRIREDLASEEDFEPDQPASFDADADDDYDDDEREVSDSESTFDHPGMDDCQEAGMVHRNAARGRDFTGSESDFEENVSGSYRGSEVSSQRHLSTSAYYINSRKDDSFVYSENAFEEEYGDDDDASSVCDVISEVARKEPEILCRGLDHADMLGLSKTNTRLRCLINWLIGSMLKLYHPGSEESHRLVQIYGPKITYDRGASVAFNLFDWKGNLLQPILVQRLADRSNISLGTTMLHHIRLPENYRDWPGFLESNRNSSVGTPTVGGGLEGGGKSPSIEVITASLGFITNFDDVYRFWAFLAKFLDADFVAKEQWRYRSLNQSTVVLMQDATNSPLH